MVGTCVGMGGSEDLLDSIGSGSQDVNSIAAQLDAIAGGRGPSNGSANTEAAAGATQRAMATPASGRGPAPTALGMSVSAQRAAMLAQMQGMAAPRGSGMLRQGQQAPQAATSGSHAQAAAGSGRPQALSAASQHKALTLIKVVDAMKLRLGLDAKQISLVVTLQRQFMGGEIDFQVYVVRLQHIIGRDTFAQVIKTFEGVREKILAQEGARTSPAIPAPQRPAVMPVAPRSTTVSAPRSTVVAAPRNTATTASTPAFSGGLAQGMLGKRTAPLSPRASQAQPLSRFNSLPAQPLSIPRGALPSDPASRLPPSLQQQLVVNIAVMQRKVQEVAARKSLQVNDNVYLFLALAVQSRLKGTMEMLIAYSKKRSDEHKDSLPIAVTFEPKVLLRKIGEKDEQDQRRRDEEERLRLLSEAATGDEGAKKEKLQKFLDAEDNKRTNNAALQAAMITSKFKNKISMANIHTSAASVLPPSTLKLGTGSAADLASGRGRRITTRDMHAFLEHDICLRSGNSSLPYIAFSGKGMARKVKAR